MAGGGGMQGFGGQGGGFGGGMGFQQPQQSFGMPSGFSRPAQFNNVGDLYQNVLNRTPDPSGLQYWQNRFGPSIDQDELSLFRMAAAPEIAARAHTYKPMYADYSMGDPMSISNYGVPQPSFQSPFSMQRPASMPIVTRSAGVRGAPAMRRAEGGITDLLDK